MRKSRSRLRYVKNIGVLFQAKSEFRSIGANTAVY